MEAGAEEGVGEDEEGKIGMWEAEMETEEVEEAEGETRLVEGLEEEEFDVAGVEVGGDEGGGEGRRPCLVFGEEDVEEGVYEAGVGV